MKALSLSRAGLAAEMGVHKSVTSRWVSGKATPSSHNLARLSQLIAQRRAGFTMLDWDLQPDAFKALFTRAPAAPPLQQSFKTIWPLLPEKLAQEATHSATERTRAYEGFWRTTRPSSDLPGQFLHDVSIARRDENGFLKFLSGVEGFVYEGSAVLIGQQLYYFAADDTFGAISFGILNGVPRQRAEVLDGVILTTLRDAGASPAASTFIMHRIGDLTDDTAADDARFKDLVETQRLVAEPGSVPEDVARHLHDAANAPGMLRLLFAQSMSRGPIVSG